jgi:uncharacterized protein YqgC (DUF456 family)
MDTFLIITGIILLLAGLAGCVLPALPGPPLSYIALLLLHFTGRYQFSNKFLIIWLIITAVVVILDYLVPVWGAKKFGAGKRGVWGSIIGLLLGFFIFPPFGIILGPFLGAVIGEMSSGKETGAALKAGFGSFAGFIAGTLLKLVASGMMTWYFIRELF